MWGLLHQSSDALKLAPGSWTEGGRRWAPEVGVLAPSQLPCTSHWLQLSGFSIKKWVKLFGNVDRLCGGRQSLQVLTENLAPTTLWLCYLGRVIYAPRPQFPHLSNGSHCSVHQASHIRHIKPLTCEVRAHLKGSTVDIIILIIMVIIIMYLIFLCGPRAHIRRTILPPPSW